MSLVMHTIITRHDTLTPLYNLALVWLYFVSLSALIKDIKVSE